MATPVDLALDHYADRLSFVDAAAQVAGQMWDQIDPARIVDSWAAQVPELTAVVSGAQLGVARRADPYVTDVLEADDVDAAAVAQVDPRGFAGQASDARGLVSLLTNPVFVTLTTIQDGLDLARALGAGRANLDLLVRTQVADAGRLADQTAITARPKATGYVRMAVGNSCGRCLILSGKHYAWNTGFQRHPRCDCIHVPAGSRTALRIRSPQDVYASMSTKERLRAGFTRADQKALAEGADLNQVVNARRGLQTAGGRRFTTEGTTKRGVFGSTRRGQRRLSVDQIYLEAGDNRTEAIRLLQRNGYLFAPARDRAAAAAKVAGGGPTPTPAQIAAAHAVPIRPELAQARTVRDVEAAFRAEAKIITDRDIPAWFGTDASPQTAREHAEGVLRALERFPEAELDRLTWFRDEIGNDMARAGGGLISFNLAFAGTAGRPKYLRDLAKGVAGWDEGGRIGSFSFRGSANPAAVAIHEFGHILELDTIGASLAPRVEALVRELAERERIGEWLLVSRQVSRYATTNTTELIAEAFGDAILNGERASELSRGILTLIEEEYSARGLVMFTPAELEFGRAAKAATDELAKLTIAQLRALFRQRGLRGLSKLRKAELVEALQTAPASTLTGKAAIRAAARERQRQIAQAEGTARLLAEIDELIAKRADAAVIRERLNLDLLGPEQLFANADPAVLPVLRRALDSGDPAKLRAAVTRLSKNSGLTPGAAAGRTAKFDPSLHEPLGATPKPGATVRVLRRGTSITMPDGEVIQLTKAQVTLDATGVPQTAQQIAAAKRRRTLQAAINRTPVSEPTMLGGGQSAETHLVDLGRGQRYVTKRYGTRFTMTADELKHEIDGEVLGPLVLDAVGGRAAAVIRAGTDSVAVDFIKGRHIDAWSASSRQLRDLRALVASDQGRLMGLADFISANADRNDGNWMVTRAGHLVGFDHAGVFSPAFDLDFVPSSTFTDYLRDDHFRLRTLVDWNPADLARIHARLDALKPAFADAGRADWHTTMMQRLALLEQRADATAPVRLS